MTENTTLLAVPYQDTNRNQSFDFLRSNAENDTTYAPRGATAIVSQGNVTVEQTPQTSEPGVTARNSTESTEESSNAGIGSLFQSLEIVVVIAMILVTYLYFRLT